MSATIPQTPTCYIDATGIHAPTYEDVLTYLQQQYQAIYGADVYLGNDSQDGQLLALFASAIHDCNSMAVGVYQAFSPATAIGAGLSSVVKINNIRREIATNSTVDLLLVGQAGRTITNGIARDENQQNWLLPPVVTFPTSGQITVTCIAANEGAITAAPGTITTILTPMRGWQSVTNVMAAVPGDPVETDATLRRRQATSTALPSQTVLDGMLGAVAGVAGVLRLKAYENDTNATDVNGVPANSVAFVVDGGNASDIALAIANKKTPGVGTYGTTSEEIIDSQEMTKTINFFRPSLVPITVAITLQPLTGYNASTADAIAASIAAFISAEDIGEDVYLTRLYGPALLVGLSTTYNITGLQISRGGVPVASADVVIAFNEAATCTTDNVTVTALVT